MSANSESSGVDVCIESLDAQTPHCPHGPTILFERFTKGEKRRFYACSACRDRKSCSFFQYADESVSKAKQKSRAALNKELQPRFNQKQYIERRESFLKLDPSQQQFCVTCGEFVLPAEVSEHGKEHKLKTVSPDDQLKSPSKLLTPLDNNKTNAQFLFSEKAVTFTMSCIKSLGYTHVLCIGTPRLHEAIATPCRVPATDTHGDNPDGISQPLRSLLLDIDHRFAQFYGEEEFCHYNMFNHHLFERHCHDTFMKFIAEPEFGKLVLVTDPPFGGRVEVLAHTMKKISEAYKNTPHAFSDEPGEGACELPVLWFFPYYMEPRIKECLPNYSMLDYKVDYENHEVFQGGPKGRKYGSPVRIFTNLPLVKFDLSKEEGYRFCSKCQKYVSNENVHCDKCQTCPSKDGQTYRHCEVCKRCVKPSRVHCDKCEQCLPPDHKCGITQGAGCHVCGEHGHKRRECPQKTQIFAERKRKNKEQSRKKGKRQKLSKAKRLQ